MWYWERKQGVKGAIAETLESGAEDRGKGKARECDSWNGRCNEERLSKANCEEDKGINGRIVGPE